MIDVKVYGDSILRTVCTETDDNIFNRKNALELAIYFSKMSTAVGIAAPQIGLNLRIFCMLDNHKNLLTVINPQINKREGLLSLSEGCLSIPKIFATTNIRSKKISATYYDENFKLKNVEFSEFEAVIFQHEYDHLNGVLFIDHLSKDGREKIEENLKKIEKHPIRSYHPIFKSDTQTIINSKQALYK